MKAMDRETLLALDNAAIIAQAAAAGHKIYPEDLLVNYAEIDFELTMREDLMLKRITKRINAAAEEWLQQISDKKDVTPGELPLDQIFYEEILEHIHSVWSYGSRSADRELERMQLAQNGELDQINIFANDKGGGKKASDDDLWNDALEWYDQYAKDLSAAAKQDLFIKMQPEILAAIDAGVVRTGLVAMILEKFARIGEVRADIIGRTEGTKAYNWGRRYKFDESEALAGYRYSAIMDSRTSPICTALHGKSWPKGSDEMDFYTPPNHFRCRSVIVPIHKYQSWAFEDADLTDLSEKDRSMLERFGDSSFYPKRKRSEPDDGEE